MTTRDDRGFHSLALLLGLLASGHCFGEFLLSGGNRIAGDFGDARLGIALLEHWYDVYRGGDAWLSPPFFFPVQHVLAYSSTLFLQSLPYSCLRLAGCDPYVACEVTLWLLAQAGYLAMIALLRRLGLRRGFALLGALLFTFSNLFHSHLLPHAYTIMLVPLLALCVMQGLGPGDHRSARRAVWLSAGGALLSGILFSDLYTGWFLIFFSATTAVLALLIEPRAVRRGLALLRARRRAVAWAGLTAALALLPFCVTYGPAIRAGQGRSYDEVVRNAMSFGDLFNVGSHNLVWGWLMSRLDPRFSNDGWDYGLPPGLLVAFAAGCVVFCRGWLRTARAARAPTAETARWEEAARPAPVAAATRGGRALLFTAMAAAVLVIWALLVRTPAGSLWHIVWAGVPGGDVIRLTFRFQYQLSMAVVMVAVAALSAAWEAASESGTGEAPLRSSGGKRWPRWLAWPRWPRWLRWPRWTRRHLTLTAIGAGSVWLVVEQIDLTRTHGIDRREELARLTAAAARLGPPCRSFYVVDTSAGGSAHPSPIALQIDGMLIAERLGRPTLNGYSGWSPPGWHLDDPRAGDYLGQIQGWSAEHRLSAVCALDLSPPASRETLTLH